MEYRIIPWSLARVWLVGDTAPIGWASREMTLVRPFGRRYEARKEQASVDRSDFGFGF